MGVFVGLFVIISLALFFSIVPLFVIGHGVVCFLNLVFVCPCPFIILNGSLVFFTKEQYFNESWLRKKKAKLSNSHVLDSPPTNTS